MAINKTVVNKTAIMVYVPVLHRGYMQLFEKYPAADLAIVDKGLLEGEFRSIQKDIRALETQQIVNSLQTLLPDRKIIHLKNEADIGDYEQIIMSEDEISDWLQKKFFADTNEKIKFDSIFLRWSEAKTKQKKDVIPDDEVTTAELHQQFMGQAVVESQKSGDWWRQTAAAIAKDGKLIAIAHNKHVPSDQNQYIFGDPRANFSRGVAIEISTAFHAEEVVIADVARQGISLDGADLYVTIFPCPYCARLIAYSGIKRVFYKEGYSMVDGAEIMRGQGVKLIKVRI
ncbi:hypothetical protein KJ628_04980 [Patescibacteria group bacterium]|nr:hypothetical protein [Patescibacteria group bacterium]